MPQVQFPIFPACSVEANRELAILTDRKFPGDKWPAAAELARHPVRLA
jgi:hypothetical protein